MEFGIENLEAFVDILKNDGVIIFPTDTVWGVGCLLNSEKGIQRIYNIKKREKTKPMGIFVSDIGMAQEYGEFNDEALKLANSHWPGGLSLVVNAKENVSKSIQNKNGTVSIRIPAQTVLIELIAKLKIPLVQTSANFANEDTPFTKKELDTKFVALVDRVIDGITGNQLPSTIIDASKKELRLLRQGPITIE